MDVIEKFINKKYIQVLLKIGFCTLQAFLLFGDSTLSDLECAALLSVTVLLVFIL